MLASSPAPGATVLRSVHDDPGGRAAPGGKAA
jgi:hypothetical protein